MLFVLVTVPDLGPEAQGHLPALGPLTPVEG